MSPAVVVTLILVIGLALVVAAALADRRSALRAAPGRPSAGQYPMPALHTIDPAEEPSYITSTELLRQAPPARALAPQQERELTTQLAAASTITVTCGLAAPSLATHTGERAILDRPAVLVCPDTISQLRELTALLAQASQRHQALLVAAPALDAETLRTLIANKLAGTLQIAVVLGDVASLTTLAAAAGSPLSPLGDRQSGAVRLEALGRPRQIVASRTTTSIIDEPQR